MIGAGFDKTHFVVIVDLVNIYGKTEKYQIIKISLNDLILNEGQEEIRTAQNDEYDDVLKRDDFDARPIDWRWGQDISFFVIHCVSGT